MQKGISIIVVEYIDITIKRSLSMINTQQKMVISRYSELYDILISKDNLLRQIKELVDFSFVLDELSKNYDLNQGRKAKDPIQMFKYLLLKDMYEISDSDLVERTRCDMSFKYFLDLAPEEIDLIHPSLLTKFRRLRLKNIELLDLLITKTVEIAMEQGIQLGKAIIVDATHTGSRYHQRSAEEVLLERAKKLRKEVYGVDESFKERFPKKIVNPSLDDVVNYCDRIVEVIEESPKLCIRDNIQQRLNYLKEGLDDTESVLESIGDSDARLGHKSKDDSFFGYKTHLGMTEERLITAAIITTGEKGDGPELEQLIEKSKANGIEVKEVIGDTAYSGKDNLEYTSGNDIKMIAKLNPVISQGTRKKKDEYIFNKDAGLFVCPGGHLAMRKGRTGKKNTNNNQVTTYYFDIEKCKKCTQRDGCYKEGAKSKTYSVSIKSDTHKEQMVFEGTDYFKERYKERYMIEAKNSELKNRHGYDQAISSGLVGMTIQGAMAIFNVNIKRILTLKNKK